MGVVVSGAESGGPRVLPTLPSLCLRPTAREMTERMIRAKLREVMATTDLESITSKEVGCWDKGVLEEEVMGVCGKEEVRDWKGVCVGG